MSVAPFLFQRQEQGEGRTAGLAVTLDQALVLANYVLGDRQSQSSTFSPAADHGVKNTFDDVRRNAGAVIDHFQSAHQAVACLANGKLAQRASAQGNAALFQRAVFGYRLHGVAHNIQQCLNQLFAIGKDVRNAGIIITL